MTTKILVANNEKCTGCRLCEMVCSVNKEGVSNPAMSSIHVIKWEMEGLYMPMFCQQCEEPLCAAVCPVNAIQRDESLGRLIVDKDLCIGCKSCISVCSLGGIGFNEQDKKVFRCDLCDGDPTCVKYCQTKALEYTDSDRVMLNKQRNAAKKLLTVLSGK